MWHVVQKMCNRLSSEWVNEIGGLSWPLVSGVGGGFFVDIKKQFEGGHSSFRAAIMYDLDFIDADFLELLTNNVQTPEDLVGFLKTVNDARNPSLLRQRANREEKVSLLSGMNNVPSSCGFLQRLCWAAMFRLKSPYAESTQRVLFREHSTVQAFRLVAMRKRIQQINRYRKLMSSCYLLMGISDGLLHCRTTGHQHEKKRGRYIRLISVDAHWKHTEKRSVPTTNYRIRVMFRFRCSCLFKYYSP